MYPKCHGFLILTKNAQRAKYHCYILERNMTLYEACLQHILKNTSRKVGYNQLMFICVLKLVIQRATRAQVLDLCFDFLDQKSVCFDRLD